MVLVNKYLAIVKENLQKKNSIHQSIKTLSIRIENYFLYQLLRLQCLQSSVYSQIYQIKLKKCLCQIPGPFESHFSSAHRYFALLQKLSHKIIKVMYEFKLPDDWSVFSDIYLRRGSGRTWPAQSPCC
jgi:hypothetical protein